MIICQMAWWTGGHVYIPTTCHLTHTGPCYFLEESELCWPQNGSCKLERARMLHIQCKWEVTLCCLIGASNAVLVQSSYDTGKQVSDPMFSYRFNVTQSILVSHVGLPRLIHPHVRMTGEWHHIYTHTCHTCTRTHTHTHAHTHTHKHTHTHTHSLTIAVFLQSPNSQRRLSSSAVYVGER